MNTIPYRIQVKCPYCRKEILICANFNALNLETSYSVTRVYCNCDDGGCDSFFIVYLQYLKPEKIDIIKIPGEQEEDYEPTTPATSG